MEKLTRARYRRIKAYNNEQLSAYLEEVFAAGYKAGKESVLNVNKKEEPEKAESEAEDE